MAISGAGSSAEPYPRLQEVTRGSLPLSFPPQGLGGMLMTTAMTRNGLVPEFTVTGGENAIVCYPVIKTGNKSHRQRIASCLSGLMKRETNLNISTKLC